MLTLLLILLFLILFYHHQIEALNKSWLNYEGKQSGTQVKSLINKDLLKQSVTENTSIKDTDYVIVTKDQSGTITSEKLDEVKKILDEYKFSSFP